MYLPSISHTIGRVNIFSRKQSERQQMVYSLNNICSSLTNLYSNFLQYLSGKEAAAGWLRKIKAWCVCGFAIPRGKDTLIINKKIKGQCILCVEI